MRKPWKRTFVAALLITAMTVFPSFPPDTQAAGASKSRQVILQPIPKPPIR